MATTSAPPHGASIVARSAVLTLSAAQSDHSLALQVARASDHRLIAGPGNVTATLDGHNVPVTARPDGTYVISTRDQSAGAHSLDVVVSHDGIRELLTGKVTVPQQQSVFEMLQGHGMFAWWVLNIAVVLIAVLVISRRRG
ncbi:MAG TPA: hypothetical protein VGR92_10785 [Steroidobacteraceae bacterium]|nr:hypothetical protein [Steroidobacteraceae bacterium]